MATQHLQILKDMQEYIEHQYERMDPVNLDNDIDIFNALIVHEEIINHEEIAKLNAVHPNYIQIAHQERLKQIEPYYAQIVYQKCITSLEVLIAINQMIEQLTKNQTNDAQFNYAAIERLSQLATQVINHQTRQPNAQLIYNDAKLWKLLGAKQPLTELRQIPKAIGMMRYSDVLDRIQVVIKKLETFGQRYQPFLYVAKQHPNEPFNYDQFGNYLKQVHIDSVELVDSKTKIIDTLEQIRVNNESGETEINKAIVDQLKEQRGQAKYNLLYNNETMDEDIMTEGIINPLTNAEVQTVLEIND